MSEKEGSGTFKRYKHDFKPPQRKDGKGGAVDSSSPVILAFKSFQHELDARHDKYERIVKYSRDITTESKRTIFLLHRVISEPNKDDVLAEAKKKLDGVREKMKQVAQELVDEDVYQYHRAITSGLQEYVEAVTFQHFITHRALLSLDDINRQLIFENNVSIINIASNNEDQTKQNILSLQISHVDYLLGVADLTGELMRLCIGSVGNGDIDTPFELTQFLREIFDGFAYIGNTGPYEISRKLYTLKQSLGKVENACYMLKVRGSEIPKHMLADLFVSKSELLEHDDGMS
ncbi:PREDICTED: translin-associated protein X isoform X3 [Nanorana parkeri]|uniref:translin-associated protein X isoform X3 n=1 Tax=Nanorana parkeri TaxID=125878 RepID=UPI0008548E63|nr:PREDICTED: translin-associated protein X isoform X3 [Nanorana parkeri]